MSLASLTILPHAQATTTQQIGKFGGWTVSRSVEDTTAVQATCSAEYIGGGMKLTATSLQVTTGLPVHAGPWGNLARLAFDGEPFALQLGKEQGGVTQHFGFISLEGDAFAKAIKAQRVEITVGATDIVKNVTGATLALQQLQKACA